MRVYSGCATDKGIVKKKNQDRAVCHVWQKREKLLAVACVCDGIGSFSQGEIASEMMTRGITNWFHGMEALFPEEIDEEVLPKDLEETVTELNELIHTYRLRSGIDIGCTMSILLLINRNYYVFHVGDSRIYLLRSNLMQITRDEVSMVEEDGRIRSVLANYIGKSNSLWMNKLSGDISEGDRFIIGSDGLFKKLSWGDIQTVAAAVNNDQNAQKACQNIMSLVMGRGERDNISCVLFCMAS